MLRTFGSDLTSLINSDPAWKLSKGSRSSSRRARKTVSKSVEHRVLEGCRNSKDFNMPVSESKKQRVAALGCRFSEKAEHVPIKKRRFLFRSPSPPPVITSTAAETVAIAKTEESNQHGAPKSASSEIIRTNIDNNVGIGTKKSGEDEDFSGISILAAAACGSSVGREYDDAEHSTIVEESSVHRTTEVSTIIKDSLSKEILKEDPLSSSEMSTGGTLSCISTEPVGERASFSPAINFSQEVVANKKCIERTSMAAASLTSSGKASCAKEKKMDGNQRPPSRDVRLHWDLNVVMDAWEEPSGDTEVHHLPHNMPRDAVKSNQDAHDKRARACVEQSSSGRINANHDRTGRLNVNQHVSVDHATQTLASRGLNEADNPTVKTLNLNGDKRHGEQQVSEGFNSRVVSSNDVENFNIVSASNTACGTTSVETHASSRVSSRLDTLRNVTQSIALSEDAQVAVLDGKVPEVSNNCSVNVDHNNANTMSSSQVKPKESHELHLGEISKGNLNNCMKYSERDGNEEGAEYNDDVSGRHDAMIAAGTDVIQEGYDSQYEDGELRESTELAWEECDDVTREYEEVDYGSDNIGTCISNPSNHHNSESRQIEGRKNGGCHVEDEVCNQAAKADEDVKENAEDIFKPNLGLAVEKIEVSRGLEQRESSKSCSDIVTGVTNDDARKDKVPTHDDMLVDSKDTETREDSKAFRRAVQSRIEGPNSRDGTFRDERPYRFETRFEPGSTRSFERGRHSYYNQGRGRQGGSWDGPSDYRRGYKRHYSPINYRRSKLDDDAVMERDDIGCDGSRDDLSFSHQLPNSRTTADEEPCPGLQSRYGPDRKFSPDRGAGFGRGRPFRYGPLAERRAGRGRYNGPSTDESFQSSLKYRRPLSRRERSISPFGGRGQPNINHSRGKSPSRSRSRSPVVWDSARERPGAGRGGNSFIRHRSRSPNFRSQVRMQRVRSPNQQPGFGDHATGFRSISRTHSSPPRNRWNTGRKDEIGQFREFGYKQRNTPLERSPGRFRSRGDRDGITESPRNLKPDGYGRFPDRGSEDGAGRGLRYADNYEERRKPYNFLRPARRSYEDGMASRLHQDMDDGFSNTNNIRNRDAPRFRGRGGFRGVDNRIGDMQRRFRGEQQSFVYERDATDSSRNQKSEDQFHASQSGRYADMDGANQGHRFNNYEDRRKQYSSNNFMRRSDNESIEDRSKLNADENFQDAPASCGSDARGFEGRVGIVSARSREDGDAAVCEPVEKQDDNSQSVGVKNSEIDLVPGSVPS